MDPSEAKRRRERNQIQDVVLIPASNKHLVEKAKMLGDRNLGLWENRQSFRIRLDYYKVNYFYM